VHEELSNPLANARSCACGIVWSPALSTSGVGCAGATSKMFMPSKPALSLQISLFVTWMVGVDEAGRCRLVSPC